MAEDGVVYKGGYKYQLHESYEVTVRIHPSEDIKTDYISLDQKGRLIIWKGYAWDGPSGPTIDTSNFMRGSLVHDALYQLIRMKFLSNELHRESADKELKRMCLQDGMSSMRAWWVYESVRQFGGRAASAANVKPVRRAPKREGIRHEADDTDVANDASDTSRKDRVHREADDVSVDDDYLDLAE